MSSLKIGQIVSVHGIKGEVKVYSYTNDNENLLNLKSVFLDSELTIKYNIKNIRIQKNMLVIKFDNINSIEETKTLMNKYIYINKEKIKEKNTYYIEDLIGLDVYQINNNFDDAKYFGKLTDILQPGANDVYEVKTENTTVYLPAIKDVIIKIDLENSKIYVEIMEGLI